MRSSVGTSSSSTPGRRAAPRPPAADCPGRGIRVEDENWRVRRTHALLADAVITAARNDSGALVGFAKVTRDLTERRDASWP
jgi:hypothetical protein